MVERGDKFEWMGVRMEAIRVAKSGAWADFSCERDGAQAAGLSTWVKRHKLPLPEAALKISGPLKVGSPEHQALERAYVDRMAAEDVAREEEDDGGDDE